MLKEEDGNEIKWPRSARIVDWRGEKEEEEQKSM